MTALPPPPPPKPQHAKLSPPSSQAEEGIVEENAFSVSAARALFEAAKKPEVQRAASAIAKNPVLRNTAINAAKDPNTRNAAVSYLNSTSSKPPTKAGDGPPPPPPPHRTGAAAPPPAAKPKPVYKEPSFELAPPAPSISSYNRGPPLPPKSGSKPTYPSMIDELKSLHINTSGPSGYSQQPNYMQSSYMPSQPPPPPSMTYTPSGVVLPPKPSRPPPPKPSSPRTMPPAPTTEPHAIVRYPITGSQQDELTCDVNDIILLKKEVDDQWIYGLNTRTGKQGIIPISFIDVKIPLAPTSSTHTATALYDYYSNTPGDLQFRANDLIQVKEWANPEWLLGSLYGQSGIFPANYVSCPTLHAVPRGSSYNAAPAGPIGIFIATHSYNSGVPGDLIFNEGDQIEVLEYVGQDWVRGRLFAQEGILPFTYLSSQNPKKSPKGLASIATIASIPAREPKKYTMQKLFQAMEDHHSDDPSNLYFSKGDRIIVVEEVDDHFYRGKLEEFRTLPPGLIPRNKIVEL